MERGYAKEMYGHIDLNADDFQLKKGLFITCIVI